MIVVLLFILIVCGIAIFPILIPYLLTGYMVLDGVASRQFVHNLNVSLGGANIFLPDLLYAASIILAALGFIRLFTRGLLRWHAPLTKTSVFLVVCYFLFFTGKMISGYFEGVPTDTLIRFFSLDTQFAYFFIPLMYLRQERTLKKLLYFVVAVTLLFPLVQPFLYGSADQIYLAQGQGTLRLGFGNANLLLMLGVLAFFVWERKMWLSAIPLAGIAMLAQRSAFISLALCIVVLSFQKRKSIKFIALMSVAGALLIVALMVIQTASTIPVVDKAVERFSQTFEKTGTTQARMDVLPQALGEIEKRPWVGFGYIDMYALQQKQERDPFAFNMLHPHNFVLSLFLRTGVIGAMLLFALIGLAMMAPFRLSRQPETKEQGMYLFSTTLFFVVFSLMNTSFESAGYVFWVLMGISLWYLNQAHYNKHQERRISQ